MLGLCCGRCLRLRRRLFCHGRLRPLLVRGISGKRALEGEQVSGGDSARIGGQEEKGETDDDEWKDQVQSTVQEGEYRLI